MLTEQEKEALRTAPDMMINHFDTNFGYISVAYTFEGKR